MRMNFSYLRQEEESLKKERKQVQYGAFGMIALLVIVLLVSVLRQYMLTMVSLIIVFFVQIFVFRRLQKKYRDHLQRVNLLTVTGGLLNTEVLDEKGGAGLSMETLRNAELLSYQEKGKEVNFYLGMHGKYEKMDVTTADAAIVQFFGADARKAEVNCGNWTHIVLQKDTGLNLRILDRESMRLSVLQDYFASLPHLSAVEKPEWELPESLLIFADKEKDTEIPEAFLSRLSEFVKYTPGKVAVSIHGQEVDVYVKNRFLGSNFKTNIEPTEQILTANSYPELEKLLRMTAALN